MSYTSLHSKTYSVGSFNSADFVMRYNITFLCQFSMLLFYFDFGLFICFQVELTELDANYSNYYLYVFIPNSIFLSKFLPGTLQRAIGETQSAFEYGLGGEGTILLHEYYVQKYIRMLDTRGFFAQDEKLVDECLDILTGR